MVCVIINNLESLILSESARQCTSTVTFLYPSDRGFLSRLSSMPRITHLVDFLENKRDECTSKRETNFCPFIFSSKCPWIQMRATSHFKLLASVSLCLSSNHLPLAVLLL